MDLRSAIQPLHEAKPWMKFIGGALVAIGVLYALTIVGLLIAWLFIWLGVLLYSAGSEIERASASGDEAQIWFAFNKLRRFFVVGGIALLVYLVAILGFAVVGVLALLGFGGLLT